MAWWDCEVFKLLVSRLHTRLRKKTQNLGLFGPILGQRECYQQIAARPFLGHSGNDLLR